MVRAGLPEPLANLEITDASGRTVYWIDLAYEGPRLGIEYVGAVHVADRQHMQRDARRRRALEDNGWRLITVTAADLITDPLGVVESIRAALNGRR
ncbi:MAG: DUF559 domain-containing protein [Propionibacteriaceae bacterium]|nr:DUF559 domain-containing protein [Propionibacteriaceae bacterium]